MTSVQKHHILWQCKEGFIFLFLGSLAGYKQGSDMLVLAAFLCLPPFPPRLPLPFPASFSPFLSSLLTSLHSCPFTPLPRPVSITQSTEVWMFECWGGKSCSVCEPVSDCVFVWYGSEGLCVCLHANVCMLVPNYSRVAGRCMCQCAAWYQDCASRTTAETDVS